MFALNRAWLFCSLTVVAISLSQACKADAESDVLAAADALFAAIEARDAERFASLQIPEGASLSMRATEDGEYTQRLRRNEELFALVAEPERRLKEVWLAQPQVLVDGPIALVWGRYRFYINDQASHDGANAMQFIHDGERWILANWTWTVEPLADD
ncbi:MAG: hypothetical protein AAGJ86_10455 [Pseudomonadota bacterium]